MNEPEHSRARWRELIERHLRGQISEDESRELEAALSAHRDVRDEFRRRCNVDAALRHAATVLQAETAAPVTHHPKERTPDTTRRLWLQWRPLATAAAAGLVIGLFGASVVFGFAYPPPRSVTLLDENFEGEPSVASKVVLEPDVWRSDHAVIVRPEQGVQPQSGQRMLRFLEEGQQGRNRPAGSHIADVYRLIDLRDQRESVVEGEMVAHASVRVNATPIPKNERFRCEISLFALDAASVPRGASYIGTALESEASAMARSGRTYLDSDPASWQRLATEMRLPTNTDYIVVRLHISQSFESHDSRVFTGSYADDVRVTLTRRSPLP